MVRVCDAIMGTGKSSAAITYLNEHPDDKFIYITPYLDEAARIRRKCKDAHFVEPSDKLKKYQYKKSAHTAALIRDGRNISTTHQAFKGYNADMLEDIKRHGYTLVIDENVDVLEKFNIHQDDLNMAVSAGYATESNGVYRSTGAEYNGDMFRDMLYMMRSRELVSVPESDDGNLMFWSMPPELVLAFKDVYILTYLFEGQSIHHFLKIYDIPYELIGISTDGDGRFRFCEYPGYTPDYVHHMKDAIHILDNKRMNDVGEDYHALSKSWFERGGPGVDELKKNIRNFFRNMHGDISCDRRMWGSYKDAFSKIRGSGYTKSFLPFNTKATNEYRDRDCLVYAANVFMNCGERMLYGRHGIEVDVDKFALSVMVQWIWRSAIRDGKEIYIYIPSRRMRDLLENWINSFEEGGNDTVE